MPWATNLKVPYHQQNGTKLCGPTTAMMIVDALHGGLIQEEAWWSQIQSHLGTWNTDPKGLETGLNSKAPLAFKTTNQFVAVDSASEPDGTRLLVEALCSPNAAPAAAVVWGKMHWLVVCNVNLSAKPAPHAVTTVLGFYINNPSLPPVIGPKNHTNSDSCGTSLALGSADAGQYVNYAVWSSQFFSGYKNGAASVFTTVCAKKRTAIPSLAPPPTMAGGGFKQKIEALTFVRPTMAQSAALTAISEHGLAEQEPLKDAVRNATAGEPALVRRLDLEQSFYYLIPLVRDGRVVGVARTDAVHGDFMGVGAVPNGEYHIATAGEIAHQLHGFKLSEIVWRPCQESTSPYSPFYRVTGPDGERYVDRNGNMFCTLTPLGSGG
jgi:hypothetical protein